jgi:DNA repair exonuclease SbcCD ATPase subunit
MILFKNLRWKNMLSTGNYFTEIKLNNHTNTLVVGQNGSGKSTMLDALCFALFGKAFRNITKPSLLNSINEKDCIVEVQFDIGNKEYKVVRGIKPNVFEIYQDGVLINQDAAARDYQEYLEKFILKLNYKSFTQIVILGSASFTPFMQLSASDRRSIIEDLLDIQIFSTMNSLAKERTSKNKENLLLKKNEIELLTQKYNLKNEHINKLNQDNDAKIKEYQEELELNKVQSEILQSEIKTLEWKNTRLNNIVLQMPEIETKIKQIRKIEVQIEGKITKIANDRHFYEHNDNCSTCKQTIPVEFKEKEFGDLTIKEKEFTDALEDLKIKLHEKEVKLKKIKNFQTKMHGFQVEIATKNASIKAIRLYVARLKGLIADLGVTEKDDADLNELTIIKTQIKVAQEELKELLDEKSYYEVATNLLKDSGIKTKIIKQYLPIINKMVNKYLASLDFFVNFNLDESFKETIKSRHRDDFSYHNFSEGEKQRIDMALMLTWRAIAKLKNSSSTNLLILDEVFDSSLDTTGTEELMKILHSLDDVNLFVISHKGDILQDKFANTIRFEKVKNFSRIIK